MRLEIVFRDHGHCISSAHFHRCLVAITHGRDCLSSVTTGNMAAVDCSGCALIALAAVSAGDLHMHCNAAVVFTSAISYGPVYNWRQVHLRK
jgi:hypothetical protein